MSKTDDLSAAQERATALREQMLDVIKNLPLETLAGLAKHEYDDEATVPAYRTAGQTFLFAARDAFVAWVDRARRFPSPAESALVATSWQRDTAAGSEVADAFVSLALYYSAHAADARGADIAGLTTVLDQVADTVAYNLTMEYGPQV